MSEFTREQVPRDEKPAQRRDWEHDVEPGTFTADGPRSVESFKRLKTFATAHPNVEVRLGHQH